jgi:hypothetical protein
MMKEFGKSIPLATTFAIMAVALVALDTAPAYAQPAVPVRVTNTPLPVTVGPVTIGNPITIGNPVTIGNPAANPVLTRDVDNPANEPFEFTLCWGSGTWGSYCPAGSGTHLVPVTSYLTSKTVKRLVVEYASAWCQAATDTSISAVYLARSFGDGHGIGHYFVPVTVAAPGTNNYVVAQQTRLYYNPGEGVAAGVARQGADQLCSWSVSGHLVTE